MLTAFNKTLNQSCLAMNSEKGADYLCRDCKAEVVLKKGIHKIDHFAHKNLGDCPSGGESPLHMEAKLAIAQKFKDAGFNISLEKHFDFLSGYRRADVYATKGDIRVAFEIQHSPMTFDEIMSRTQSYNENGIRVVWVPIFQQETTLYNCEADWNKKYSGILRRNYGYDFHIVTDEIRVQQWQRIMVEQNNFFILGYLAEYSCLFFGKLRAKKNRETMMEIYLKFVDNESVGIEWVKNKPNRYDDYRFCYWPDGKNYVNRIVF